MEKPYIAERQILCKRDKQFEVEIETKKKKHEDSKNTNICRKAKERRKKTKNKNRRSRKQSCKNISATEFVFETSQVFGMKGCTCACVSV